MLVSSSFTQPPPRSLSLPQLALNDENQPRHAPPLFKGMWAVSIMLDEGTWGAGTTGVTQEVGDPPSASQKQTMILLYLFFPFPHRTSHFDTVNRRSGTATARLHVPSPQVLDIPTTRRNTQHRRRLTVTPNRTKDALSHISPCRRVEKRRRNPA